MQELGLGLEQEQVVVQLEEVEQVFLQEEQVEVVVLEAELAVVVAAETAVVVHLIFLLSVSGPQNLIF